MSLMVWLPLNGDLNNQGLLGPLTQTSAPSYTSNGKIGKALSAGGVSMSAAQTSQVFNNNEVSICFWVYPNVDTGGTSGLLFGNNAMSAGNNRKFSIFLYPTANDLHLSWQNDVADTTFQGSIDTGLFPSYKWTHLAVVYKNPNIYIYINGNLVKTYTGKVSNSSTFAYTTQVINDKSSRYVNDLRIYNHCLTPKEVKEISKGLILHYPLDNNGLGNPNLVVNSQKLDNKFSTVTSAWSRSYTQEDSREEIWTATCTTAGSGGVHTGVFPKTADKIGKQYTWSCWIKANRNISLTIGSESGGTKVKAVTTEWQYLTHTWTFTDATYQSFVWYSNSGSWAVGDWFKVKDLKIEEGPNATPWCPNSADSLYTSWGMSEAIEKDCSGYKNHGTKTGTFLYSSSSPRGNMSTIFSGAQSIAAGRTAMVTDAITVSWWGYMDNWANYTRAISCTESGGWNFEPNSGKISFPLYRNGGYLIAVDTKALSEYAAGWHHFAATYDGYKSCLYVDGVKKVTSAVSNVKYPITYNSSNGIFVGAEAGSSTISPAGSYFNGYISDVRIYSTALSENDIKELYQIPISIDKSGNAFAMEFIEDQKLEFHKNGIIEASDFYENLIFNDMEAKTLSDGSCWARILHHNNKGGTVLFTRDNAINYQSTDLYSRLYALEAYRNIDGKFEFMAIQPDLDANKIYRWKQSSNPVTDSTIAGYENITNGQGGLVKCSNSTYCAVSPTNSNWWCAIGCYTAYQGGIPGFGTNVVTGTLDLYVRIPSLDKVGIYKKNYISANQILEV